MREKAPPAEDESAYGSVGDALYFAGEATHEGVNPCIHGAMETGERAAAAVCASLKAAGGAEACCSKGPSPRASRL